MGIAKNSIFGEALIFFITDSIKIAILLVAIIFFVSFLRSYLPPEKVKKVLANRFEFVGNILAAMIGIVTPFCSCSAVPLFIGFVESGVPLGVTFSYLVSAPMVNEVAAVLLLGLFGWKIALIYVVSGVVIAVVTGVIIGKFKLEGWVEDYVWKIKAGSTAVEDTKILAQRIKEARQYTFNLFKNIYPYVLLGVLLGAFIHGYAPENFLASLAGKGNIFAVPLAVLIGVPLYSNAAGTIPIVKALIEKGLPLGTALAFMMAITALSLPEMIILRKVLKPKLLSVYIAILTVGVIFTGYLFNWVM
ncbi:MAG: Permease family protein [Candidatus Kuenenbacteria bacterium GW2011_GWA2_42_15]|uniref:Permease family protein n=1 Tax=Candidatus Kuenenbacteria bacterium GW2011_GWA2_42_15 TaxID=1618677 RepID=A0A0G1B6C9_9BACT|nr:MAG: Permease family protein [Candidatus Kuenenbacteria bacterium GW2011_GWA2_42_15]